MKKKNGRIPDETQFYTEFRMNSILLGVCVVCTATIPRPLERVLLVGIYAFASRIQRVLTIQRVRVTANSAYRRFSDAVMLL